MNPMTLEEIKSNIEESSDKEYTHESGITFSLDNSGHLDFKFKGANGWLLTGDGFQTRNFRVGSARLEDALKLAEALDIITGDNLVTEKKVVEMNDEPLHMAAMKTLIVAKERSEGMVEAYEKLLIGRTVSIGN